MWQFITSCNFFLIKIRKGNWLWAETSEFSGKWGQWGLQLEEERKEKWSGCCSWEMGYSQLATMQKDRTGWFYLGQLNTWYFRDSWAFSSEMKVVQSDNLREIQPPSWGLKMQASLLCHGCQSFLGSQTSFCACSAIVFAFLGCQMYAFVSSASKNFHCL